MFGHAYALIYKLASVIQTIKKSNLLDDIRAELLDRQRAHVPGELADNRVAEPVVVQVQDVLHHLSRKPHQYQNDATRGNADWRGALT